MRRAIRRERVRMLVVDVLAHEVVVLLELIGMRDRGAEARQGGERDGRDAARNEGAEGGRDRSRKMQLSGTVIEERTLAALIADCLYLMVDRGWSSIARTATAANTVFTASQPRAARRGQR